MVQGARQQGGGSDSGRLGGLPQLIASFHSFNIGDPKAERTSPPLQVKKKKKEKKKRRRGLGKFAEDLV